MKPCAICRSSALSLSVLPPSITDRQTDRQTDTLPNTDREITRTRTHTLSLLHTYIQTDLKHLLHPQGEQEEMQREETHTQRERERQGENSVHGC